jgi:exodeoxyribonuclease VIII
MTQAAIREGYWDVGRQQYHDDRECVCHSGLEVFRESIPLYHQMYVTGELVRPGDTDAQAFGRAFHTMLLEPDLFPRQFFVRAEKIDRRKTEGKEAHARLLEEAGDRTLIEANDFDLLRGMREGVLRNPAARKLIEAEGSVERAVRWIDPDTGLPLRSLFDKVIEGDATLLDLKSAADPHPDRFARAADDFGYHRQQALYREGAEHLVGVRPRFRFLAVGKKPPFECYVYQLEEAAEDLGVRQNRELLRELRDCIDYDQWHGRGADRLVTLRLPPWAYSRPLTG